MHTLLFLPQIDLASQRGQRDDGAPGERKRRSLTCKYVYSADACIFIAGGYSNVWETRLPIEDWNAELSLLVGMGTAEMQVCQWER